MQKRAEKKSPTLFIIYHAKREYYCFSIVILVVAFSVAS